MKPPIAKVQEAFEEVSSRPPLTWEILRYGDKWLAKKQEEKDLKDIIKEELEKYPEYTNKKDKEEKYDQLLKK